MGDGHPTLRCRADGCAFIWSGPGTTRRAGAGMPRPAGPRGLADAPPATAGAAPSRGRDGGGACPAVLARLARCRPPPRSPPHGGGRRLIDALSRTRCTWHLASRGPGVRRRLPGLAVMASGPRGAGAVQRNATVSFPGPARPGARRRTPAPPRWPAAPGTPAPGRAGRRAGTGRVHPRGRLIAGQELEDVPAPRAG
jgi:hypothetical protein